MHQIDRAQQIANSFGAHAGLEVVAEFLDLGQVVVFGQQLAALEWRHAGIGDHIGFEIQHALDIAQRHVEDHAQTRRQRLEKPDVRGR